MELLQKEIIEFNLNLLRLQTVPNPPSEVSTNRNLLNIETNHVFKPQSSDETPEIPKKKPVYRR
jgi:hypothetical protein